MNCVESHVVCFWTFSGWFINVASDISPHLDSGFVSGDIFLSMSSWSASICAIWCISSWICCFNAKFACFSWLQFSLIFRNFGYCVGLNDCNWLVRVNEILFIFALSKSISLKKEVNSCINIIGNIHETIFQTPACNIWKKKIEFGLIYDKFLLGSWRRPISITDIYWLVKLFQVHAHLSFDLDTEPMAEVYGHLVVGSINLLSCCKSLRVATELNWGQYSLQISIHFGDAKT